MFQDDYKGNMTYCKQDQQEMVGREGVRQAGWVGGMAEGTLGGRPSHTGHVPQSCFVAHTGLMTLADPRKRSSES